MPNEKPPLPRSPELMSREDSALLVVDMQDTFLRLIPGHEGLLWNVGRLLEAAHLLGVKTLVTEQYPERLGATNPELARHLGSPAVKRTFSCVGCPELFQQLPDQGIGKILVVGIETHVCVQQSVLDLLSEGFRMLVAVDGVGARHAIDHQTALRRMESAGAALTTVEAAMFEWCHTSQAAEFKQISQLVRRERVES